MDSTEFILRLNELEREFESNYFLGRIDKVNNCSVCIVNKNFKGELTQVFNITDMRLGPDGDCIVIEGFMA